MDRDVERARHWFAEDLRVAAGITTAEILEAFARVPREQFVGPPPWRIGKRLMRMRGPLMEYQTFERDPSAIYHDVVIALDEQHEINNGQPSLWAMLFEDVQPRAGERVLHLGCGTGYYTAILAEIVGSKGTVSGIEISPELARRATDSLVAWPNVTVTPGNGLTISREAWDLIVVSAGVTHPLASWLSGLRPDGRLLFPLTIDSPNPRSSNGAMLLISRSREGAFAARFLTPASFVHFDGGRDPEMNSRLLQAIRLRFPKAGDVRALRQDQHEEGETCWLHTDAFCLSYREPG
ncbi:MAG TPA: methyltransferase domain-containing protein [Rhizomicrobium sp.]|nr:methyltransferase domain-containing protein [Rhizomicrobium sp.]